MGLSSTPVWVVLAVATAFSVGTLFGGLAVLQTRAGSDVSARRGSESTDGAEKADGESLSSRRNLWKRYVKQSGLVNFAVEDPVIEKREDGVVVSAKTLPKGVSMSAKAQAGNHSRSRTVVIVTVECLTYHDWQTVVFLHSLERLKSLYESHRDIEIWRAVSCDVELTEVMKGMSPYIRSPQMSPHPKTKYDFPTLNKPRALLSWMEGPGKDYDEDTEVVICDPDFLFVGPLPLGQSKRGLAVGGKYGFGNGWVRDPKIVKHCRGECDDLLNGTYNEKYWVGGPPLLMRLVDFRRIVPHWFNFTEQMVFDADPNEAWGAPGGWLADMYAYVMGAKIEKVPHYIYDTFFLSGVDDPEWNAFSEETSPMVIHYCQDYDINVAFSGKYDGRFNKHDFHERTPDLTVLSCNATRQLAMWKMKSPHPAFLDWENPPTPIWKLGPNVTREELNQSRLLFLFWQLRKGFDTAFEEFRERYC